jgi:hypothetical protein
MRPRFRTRSLKVTVACVVESFSTNDDRKSPRPSCLVMRERQKEIVIRKVVLKRLSIVFIDLD